MSAKRPALAKCGSTKSVLAAAAVAAALAVVSGCSLHMQLQALQPPRDNGEEFVGRIDERPRSPEPTTLRRLGGTSSTEEPTTTTVELGTETGGPRRQGRPSPPSKRWSSTASPPRTTRALLRKRVACFGCSDGAVVDDDDEGGAPSAGAPTRGRRRRRRRTVIPMGGTAGEGRAKAAGKPTPPHPSLDQSQCVPAARWQTTFPTNCNAFHEVDFALGVRNGHRRRRRHDDSSMAELNRTETEERNADLAIAGLGGGKWRAAWRMSQPLLGLRDDADVVVKTLQFSDRIQYDALSYRRNQIDAAINGRLAPSPHVVDAYGFCGQSALGELAAGTLDGFLDFLVDKAHRGARGGERGDAGPNTHSKAAPTVAAALTREWAKSLPKRLRLARDAARALAHLQTVDGDNVTIAHTDFRPLNLVVLPSGRVKVNDFNSGEMVLYNTSSGGPCLFRRGRPKSASKCPPERVGAGPLLPASDVYSLGSVVFGLVTGRMPYSDVPGEEDAWNMIRQGVAPRVPTLSVDEDQPGARIMLKVAQRCMTFNPLHRPLARKVAEELDRALRSATDV